jgi:hypothetical protein
MTNWNQVQPLRKWKPRQPSPEVYRRIFGREPEPVISLDFRDLSRWLVPAVGCFLLVMGSLSTHLPARYSQMAATNLVLPALTRESPAAALPGALAHSEVNSYPAKSYEWSFGARTSTAASVGGAILISYTNKLIQ